MNATTVMIILAGAVASYCLRISGHLVLSRFQRIHPRVEAGLNAVPAAVLTTIVAPAAYNGTVPELIALVVAGFVALRYGLLTVLMTGLAVYYAARYLMGGF